MNEQHKVGLTAGRPSEVRKRLLCDLMKEDAISKKVRISLDLDEDTYKRLKKHAVDMRMNVSEVLRQLIQKSII